MAAQAVEALIAPAQSAASAGRGLLSSAGGHSQKHNSTREGGTAATASGIRTDASHVWQHCPIPPGGMGKCQQSRSHRCPGHRSIRLLRCQAQVHKTLQEVQLHQPYRGREVPHCRTWVTQCWMLWLWHGYGYASATNFASEPAEQPQEG